MGQSTGTSSGINVSESQERGCRAGPPSLLFCSMWWRIRWVWGGGSGRSANSHKCFQYTRWRSGVPIDDPVLWLWPLKRCSMWSIWALVDMSSQRMGPCKKALLVVGEEPLNQATARYCGATLQQQRSTWASLKSKTVSLDFTGILLHKHIEDLKLHLSIISH